MIEPMAVHRQDLILEAALKAIRDDSYSSTRDAFTKYVASAVLGKPAIGASKE